MQSSFSELEYAAKKRQARRDCFLAESEAATPWLVLVNPVALRYGSRGCPPIGVGRMLRLYVAQQCFALSDDGGALCDSQVIGYFVGVDLSRKAAPDAATLLKFGLFLEAHQLTESIVNEINAHLAKKALVQCSYTAI